MKPYGLKVEEYPDVSDIQEMGAASHVGNLCGKSGDYHRLVEGHAKSRARRRWKRLARKIGKSECESGMLDYESKDAYEPEFSYYDEEE